MLKMWLQSTVVNWASAVFLWSSELCYLHTMLAFSEWWWWHLRTVEHSMLTSLRSAVVLKRCSEAWLKRLMSRVTKMLMCFTAASTAAVEALQISEALSFIYILVSVCISSTLQESWWCISLQEMNVHLTNSYSDLALLTWLVSLQ